MYLKERTLRRWHKSLLSQESISSYTCDGSYGLKRENALRRTVETLRHSNRSSPKAFFFCEAPCCAARRRNVNSQQVKWLLPQTVP
ncbi:hypothetical protein CDAR_516371 [Caerostris darwini]|uniref:Uncharacterized protein n=1 Tax=Caerostris darwini TaxID=1538125 RepID=A0AAV4X1Y3_9ARAC|nr:hypothetical protein CDAR_516371 [Caerostris darwini]